MVDTKLMNLINKVLNIITINISEITCFQAVEAEVGVEVEAATAVKVWWTCKQFTYYIRPTPSNIFIIFFKFKCKWILSLDNDKSSRILTMNGLIQVNDWVTLFPVSGSRSGSGGDSSKGMIYIEIHIHKHNMHLLLGVAELAAILDIATIFINQIKYIVLHKLLFDQQ